MPPLARSVQLTYLCLTFGITLAGSLIWGVNTLFLLDAGLSNLEAFAANAFFSAGMAIFEVPTGVVADTWGRRTSFLLGTITLVVGTSLYWLMWRVHAPFWEWALVSMLLGLGFTFFSGAVEAWLVDALRFAGYDGDLDAVLGRGQIASGAAMLAGSVAGGVIAQLTSLGVPFLIRAGVLLATFAIAFGLMKDLGFTPASSGHPVQAIRAVWNGAIEHGLRNRPVRWVMFAAPFASGSGFYAFYAIQPYLLELHGKPDYTVAGLGAALVAATQIVGGWLAPFIRGLFARRTTALIVAATIGAVALVLLGVTQVLWVAIVLIAAWGLAFAAEQPIRQAYVNDMIPSNHRATILSFESLVGSVGGVVQVPLGGIADVHGYPMSLALSGLFAAFAAPFLVMSRRERAPADTAGVR